MIQDPTHDAQRRFKRKHHEEKRPHSLMFSNKVQHYELLDAREAHNIRFQFTNSQGILMGKYPKLNVKLFSCLTYMNICVYMYE